MARIPSLMLKNYFCGIPVTFHPVVVFRTPLFPCDTISSSEELVDAYDSIIFQEALILASPSFKKEVDKCLLHDKKILQFDTNKIHTLHKYWIRAHSRTTPFGLFAGCGTLLWESESSSIIINNYNKIIRKTRLDMELIYQIVSKISSLPLIKNKISFYPNTSIHVVNNEIRYVDYKYGKYKKIYQQSAALLDDYLCHSLKFSKEGANIEELANSLLRLDSQVKKEDAVEYIDQLIEARILISDIEPGSTGGDPLKHVLNYLDAISPELLNSPPILEQLKSLYNLIVDLDKGTESIEKHGAIFDIISQLGISDVSKKIFNVDLKKVNIGKSVLNKKIQENILKASEILIRINRKSNNNDLIEFAHAFIKQYGQRSIPLLEALDYDTGIGYPTFDKPQLFNTFTDSIRKNKVFKNIDESQNLKYDSWDLSLHSVLINAQFNRDKDINLLELVEGNINLSKPVNLPHSLCIRFSLGFDEKGKEVILMHQSGHPSAINLLGRFGDSNPTIKNLLSEVAEFEDHKVAPAILADIVHIPQDKDGNIILRPPYRRYEIPYLSTSGVNKEFQVDVDDLLVSVIQNKVVLYSKKLKKRIIPTLSCAHNSRHNTLPVYRFLSALYGQDKDSKIDFTWGAFSNLFSYFPRVTYQGVILHAAKWKISTERCHDLLSLPKDKQIDNVNQWRKELGLPRRVALINGDSELPFDFENNFSTETLLHILRKEKMAIFKELIFDDFKSPIMDPMGGRYCNEFFATLLIENESDESNSINFVKETENVQRSFSVGSEWLYYKVYCTPTTADAIIIEKLQPLIVMLLAKGAITSWFFIRYSDPEDHLRLRFKLSSKLALSLATEDILNCLDPFLRTGLVKDIQIHTYERELERYGWNSIEACENWFHIDSKFVIKLLSVVTHCENMNLKWLFVLKSVDSILSYFEQDLSQKSKFVTDLKEKYRSEFYSVKFRSKDISDTYRSSRKSIANIMNLKGTNEEFEYNYLSKLISERDQEAQSIFLELNSLFTSRKNKVTLEELMSSFIHMHVNRYFSENQRFNEFLVYSFLEKYYKSSKITNKWSQ